MKTRAGAGAAKAKTKPNRATARPTTAARANAPGGEGANTKTAAKAKPAVTKAAPAPVLRLERASRPPLRATSPASVARRSEARAQLPPSPSSRPAPHLDWDDDRPPPVAARGIAEESLVQRWVERGDELLRRLAQHGAARHEYRADLKEGRFVWLSPEGRVSAEAHAQVVCSWSRSTSVVAMAWADPLVRPAAISRVEGMPSERDDVDEESAWRVAMAAADACGADYLYRVPTPHAWYFVALRDLTFTPEHASFSPGTPVGMVLRGLSETRQAIASRAEPAEVVRSRLTDVGSSLLHQADYAYRDTDWVARLERTGKRMLHLAGRLARPTYGSVAAGRAADEWVERDVAVDLIDALSLLEDEWTAFV